VHGLVALMEIQASRIPARLSPAGLPVPLLVQPRPLGSAADPAGLHCPAAGRRLNGPPGSYVLQAAIAACHARAHTAAETDWAQIAALYQALAVLTPSPADVLP